MWIPISTFSLHQRTITAQGSHIVERKLYFPDMTRIIGSSKQTIQLREQVRSASKSDLSVFLVGESGVGKQLVAREIHRERGGYDANFVVVDPLGATWREISASLTRARAAQPEGPLTLFIKRVDELDQATQVQLLQELEYGGLDEIRLIASVRTRQRAKQPDELTQLREDLYYALNEINIEIEPLRRRSEDVRPLADHFARRYQCGTLSREAYEALARHAWPGNVRELRSLMRRASRVERGFNPLGAEEVFEGSQLKLSDEGQLNYLLSYSWEHAKEEFGRWYWTEVWQQYAGQQNRVLEHTRVSQVWLRNRRKLYSLHPCAAPKPSERISVQPLASVQLDAE